jgi:hypothetical protein
MADEKRTNWMEDIASMLPIVLLLVGGFAFGDQPAFTSWWAKLLVFVIGVPLVFGCFYLTGIYVRFVWRLKTRSARVFAYLAFLAGLAAVVALSLLIVYWLKS